MKGSVSISRVQDHLTQYMEISIQDELSRVEFVTVKVSLEDFTKMITGLAGLECDMQVHRLDLVGKKLEHKSVIIPVNGWKIDRENSSAILEIIKPYEVNGWTGRVNDLKNSNNYNGHNSVRVSFHRYVDDTKGVI